MFGVSKDAENRVRTRKMICCGEPRKEAAKIMVSLLFLNCPIALSLNLPNYICKQK